ncbi:putative intracellular protease/amidase [Bradyrhizobium sp. USDA 10063]
MDLNGKKIAILATHGFEQSELEVPRDRLKKAGATVDVISLAAGEIKGWDMKDWGRPPHQAQRSLSKRASRCKAN